MTYPVRGIRVRLTLFYLVGFTLFLLAGWAGLAWRVDRALHRAIDRSLNETVISAAEVYAEDKGEFASEPDLVAHVISELMYADRAMIAFTPDGRVVGRSRIFRSAPSLGGLAPGSVGKSIVTIETPTGRARARAAQLPGGTTLVVAISLELVDRQRRMLMIAVLLLLPLLVLAGGVGLYLARRALAPISRLAEAANTVAAGVGAEPGPFPRLPDHPVPDELGQLTSSFNRLLDRLSAALEQVRTLLRHQQAFLEDAAHELRTPIAIVRSEAEAALAGARSPDADSRALTVVAGEATRMAAVVGDLLWLARSEATGARLTRKRLFLDDLVPELLPRIRRVPGAEGREIRLGHFEVAPARGDRILIDRALVCLLENAILHAAPAPIEISAGQDDGAAPTSWVRVRDWGPGIPPDKVDRLFERFARLNTAVPGSGLGLAIARRVAELHGGRLDVEHPADGGVAFVLRLPADRESASPAPAAAGASSG